MKVFEGKNYYEILGVARDATCQEIRAAFHEIAKVYHPDSNFYAEILQSPLTDENLSTFKLITDAYQTLISSEKRAEYDASLLPRLPDWEDTTNEVYLNEIFVQKAFKFNEPPPKPRQRRPSFGCTVRPETTASALEEELAKKNPPPKSRAAPAKRPRWMAEFLICLSFGLFIGAVLYLILQS